MNILIINQPLNNRGDESAHKAFMRRLSKEYPNASFKVLFFSANQNSIDQFNAGCSNIEYINLPTIAGYGVLLRLAVQYGVNVPLWLHPTCRAIFRYYKEADLIITAPGGICLGGFQDWDHMIKLYVGKYLSRPMAYYGRSFGPFPIDTKENRKFRKNAIDMLKYMSFLSIRDKKTAFLAKEIGLSYETTIDSAFLDTPNAKIPVELINILDKSPYIVFVPNSLTWHYAYKGRISDDMVLFFYSAILDTILKKYSGHKVIMLPQIFNSGKSGDESFFHTFYDYYNHDSRLIVLPETYSSEVQQAIIANAKLMVGSRYHSIVFALNNAVPFVALSYEHKISGLLETLNKAENMIDIVHAIDSQKSINRAVCEFERKLDLVYADQKARDKAKEIAENCFVKFKNYINSLNKA